MNHAAIQLVLAAMSAAFLIGFLMTVGSLSETTISPRGTRCLNG